MPSDEIMRRLHGFYYQRVALELHQSGHSKEEAEQEARARVIDAGWADIDTIMPKVPWEKAEELKK